MKRAAALMAALLVVTLAGCKQQPDDELTKPTKIKTIKPSGVATPLPVTVPRGTLVPFDTLVWGTGSQLHVGAKTVDIAPLKIDRIAQTTGGVLVISGGRVWSTNLTTMHDTGLTASRGFQVSPDGRYFGYIDYINGVKDEFHTPMAAAVVYDMSTGQRVVDSTLGMGNPKKDDFQDLYEDAEPQLMGYADGSVLVDTPNGSYAEPLDGSKPKPYDDDPPVTLGATQTGQPASAHRKGDGFVISPERGQAMLGPDKRYGLVDVEGVNRWTPIDGSGRVLKIAGLPDKLDIGPWFSAGGFFAIAEQGPDDRKIGIVRCDLAAGRCTQLVPESQLGASPVLSSNAPGQE